MFRTPWLLALVATAFALSGTPTSDSRVEKAPRFEGDAARIDAATRERMTGVSWRRGCPVGFADLRLVTVSRWGFDGRVHRGRLVVHRDATGAMLRTMRSLYRDRTRT